MERISALSQQVCVVNKHDAVINNYSYKHQKTDCREYIKDVAGYHMNGHNAYERKRNGKKNNEGNQGDS